jgi:hypothetical protein
MVGNVGIECLDRYLVFFSQMYYFFLKIIPSIWDPAILNRIPFYLEDDDDGVRVRTQNSVVFSLSLSLSIFS